MCGRREASYGYGKLPVKVCTSDGNHHHATKRPTEREKVVGLGRTTANRFRKAESGPKALTLYLNIAQTKVATDA